MLRHGPNSNRFHHVTFLTTASVTAGLGLPTVGCGPAESPAVAVTDSAGVTVVSSTAPRWRGEPGWRLRQQPQVEIGGEDVAEEYQLYGIVGALKLEDGRIVVGNRGTHEIRYYDPQGRYLESVGREGAGPGEFGELSSIQRFGPDSPVTGEILPVMGDRSPLKFLPAQNVELVGTVVSQPDEYADQVWIRRLGGTTDDLALAIEANVHEHASVELPRAPCYRLDLNCLVTAGRIGGYDIIVGHVSCEGRRYESAPAQLSRNEVLTDLFRELIRPTCRHHSTFRHQRVRV